MKKQILAVFDTEAEYVRRFCDYVSDKSEYPFEAAAFTSREKLQTFCREEIVDILLVAENSYDLSLKEWIKGDVIILSEEKDRKGETEQIYKYQPCGKILQEAIQYYAGSRPESEPAVLKSRKNKIRMIGMYTPVHRSMQTSFAITLGEILARDHRVLYLNFESFSGFDKRMDREFMTDMSDLIYYVTNARDALFYKLKGMTETIQNLDYIPPAFSYMDLARITLEQWFLLFKELEKHTDYEFLILDLSDNLQGLFEILRRCEKVFTLIREDSAAAAKLCQYERLLERTDYEDVAEKTLQYKLPFIRNIPMEMEQYTYGDLADYVRKLVEEEFRV